MLGGVGEVRVGRQRPARRLRKKCSECVTKHMNLLGVEKHVIQDRRMWRALIARQTPS